MTDELAMLHSWNRDVMDRPVAPARQSRASFYRGLAIGGASASLAAALIVSSFGGKGATSESPTAAMLEPLPPAELETRPAYQAPGDGPDPPVVQEEGYKIEPKRLADAFEAATGHRSAFFTYSKADSVRTVPLRIVQLPFGPALLTQDTNSETHASTGAIGIHYLEQKDGGFRVVGSWPRAVEGWDWGAPPEWRFTYKFTANPAIYAWGDGMAQGIIGKSATLTELRPEGPVTSDLIHTGYDDEGTQSSDDEPICTVEGRIANIRKGRSFDVIVTGSRTAIERYDKKDGRFVVNRKIEWELPCGYLERAG